MEAKLIKGKEVSNQIRNEIRIQIKNENLSPGLAVILVGDDPASAIYVRGKERACEEVGIFSETFRRDASITQVELTNLITELNAEKRFHGILVQSPLPSHIDEKTVIETVSAVKDVDCFHPENMGKLVSGFPYVISCTPAGIMELMKSYHINPEGKHVVVIGRSKIVGKPIANLLMQKAENANATVTVVHSRTKNIEHFTRQADILIAAIGKAHFVNASMIKENAVIIDVGVNRIPADNEKGYRVVGDVDFEDVLPKVSKITPVPGGVGPMTITMLLKNTLIAAKYQLLKE